MDDGKPRRRPPAAGNNLGKVAQIGVSGALEFLPGGSVLGELFKARRDEIGASMRAEAERRLDALYNNMLRSEGVVDADVARAMVDSKDFHALVRACLADIESEKVGAYARLAQGIACGLVHVDNRRLFILALRDLSAEEISITRYAMIASESDLMPAQGAGTIDQNEFLSSNIPGSFQAIRIANLIARGLVHEGKLSQLGIAFARAVWRAEDLTPRSIGYRTWSSKTVMIILYEMENPSLLNAANSLTAKLRDAGCRSSIVAITRETGARARMVATHAILLCGGESARMKNELEHLKNFAKRVPTIAISMTPDTITPEGVILKASLEASENLDVALDSTIRTLLN